MKVIDKRKEKLLSGFQVGDVICFWNHTDEKRYGLIVELMGRYYVAFLSDIDAKNLGPGCLSDSGWWPGCLSASAWWSDAAATKAPTNTSVSTLIEHLSTQWNHVEKVNAHLVVEN